MFTWGSRFGFGPVTLGAGHVDDDALVLAGRGIGFVLDGGEGTEEEIRGVRHDGGAAGSDFVTCLELIEFAEGMVDVGGGAKFLDITDEGGGEVGLVEVLLEQSGVFGAKAGIGIRDGHAATAATGSALLTMGQRGGVGNGGARIFRIHESSFLALAVMFQNGNCWCIPRQFS
jgi:hypothetical protein